MSEAESGILALKPVALKRKSVMHNDKVRYRVYTTHKEFIAVIAENALMAMKISGVAVPYRIVRDLPLTQNSLEDGRLMAHHMQPTMFLRPDTASRADTAFQPMHGDQGELKPFQPLSLTGMHANRQKYASMIDVAVLLDAMSGDTEPLEAPLAQYNVIMPLASMMPVLPPEDITPEIIAEDVTPVLEENGLSEQEIEKLLNEPRA